MNREILEKPFDAHQIKQREGNFGKTLNYIDGHDVIFRLNDALDARWSFTVLEHEILERSDEVMVLGKLEAGDIIKNQFGCSRITRNRETGEPVSLADDMKSAATDALKKAATLMGVGLHLYADKSSTSRKPAHNGNGGNGNGYQHNGNGNGNSNGRITAKQHKFILSLLKNNGITTKEINKRCNEAYGSVLDFLSRADASNLISELQS